MAGTELSTWKTTAIAVLVTIVGGIGVVLYQQWTSPGAGLTGNLWIDTFAPLPNFEVPPTRIGPTHAYWYLTVQNQGNKTATSVRLRCPPTDIIQVGDKFDRASGDQLLAYTDLGELRPGDQVSISGWRTVPLEPTLDEFSISHDDGYGVIVMGPRGHQHKP